MTVLASRRGRGLVSSAPTGIGAHSRIAGPVWRAPAATGTSNGVLAGRSVGLAGDLPDKAGELAGDGDGDGGASLAAAGVEVRPAPGEAELCAPRGVDRGGGVGVAAGARGRRGGGGAAGGARPPPPKGP